MNEKASNLSSGPQGNPSINPIISGGNPFVSFMQAVFQTTQVTTVAEARQMIEQKFESEFKPDQDQVEYLRKEREL